MNKKIFILFIISGCLFTSGLFAQMTYLHGTDNEFRMGLHAGNQFRTTFYNDGTYGAINPWTPDEIIGEWPINSSHYYLMDGNIFVGSEVIDTNNQLIHILSENKSYNTGGSTGDKRPDGSWRTFLPLPGFANQSGDRIAMAKGGSEWPDSWPSYWPDIADPKNPYGIYNPDGWAGCWNGYFGKNVFNADEESYFVADDYENDEFAFFPDANNPNRRGLGLRIYVRGFQWAKAPVEDGIFCLFDIENIGTHLHNKMVFGYKIGNNIGMCSENEQDTGDDNAAFDRELDLAYMWDNDLIGGACWGPDPVGYMGGAFLESPGNPYDGIDNDNDGISGSGKTISEDLFAPKTLSLGDQIVFINYDTYDRIVTTLGDTLTRLGKNSTDTLSITFNNATFRYWAGKTLTEDPTGSNLFDDNLNGLVDENRKPEGATQALYLGYKYVDYFTGEGLNNPLIDERRDDGIDNDNDWDIIYDDLGVDGIGPNSRDYDGADIGEGDGQPTAGEPHFDKTDIDETDMLGLTSFNLYEWTSINQNDDEAYWQAMAPGYFSTNMTGSNVELLYGCGYFPLSPGQVERLSIAIICGTNYNDLVRNKNNFADAYNRNYNFAKAPNIPTVRAVAGDNKVTLFWDTFAEDSDDPITGKDFEGYKIYRSTDPGWNDCTPITDGYGSVIFREPLAQFDLDNGIYGFADIPTQGVHFWLGNDTGLRHYWVDTTAVNGYTYYYAVTSYDHGTQQPSGSLIIDSLKIDPSECSKFISIAASGTVEKGSNVAIVRPEAPSAGYKPAEMESGIIPGPNNTATGTINYTIYDNTNIKNNHQYQITFKDSLSGTGVTATKSTKSFTLVNTTTNDTLIYDHSLEGGAEGLPIVDGFQLSFANNPEKLEVDMDRSGWNTPGIPEFRFRPENRAKPEDLYTSDFKIAFRDAPDPSLPKPIFYYKGSSSKLYEPIPVNFEVISLKENKNIPFAFREKHATTTADSGIFSYDLTSTVKYDEIIFLSPDSLPSWKAIYYITATTKDSLVPRTGDTLTIRLKFPFLSHDVFEFTSKIDTIDVEKAKNDLSKIRVVPNPYVVTNTWEPKNPYSSGRGERQLHFIHLPAKCTIKIFNVRGQLVDTIKRDSQLDDGTEIWDMLSKDNLEIAYGIYIYHVQAEGIGEKTGKFVVVK